jgi:hypothetical protein
MIMKYCSCILPVLYGPDVCNNCKVKDFVDIKNLQIRRQKDEDHALVIDSFDESAIMDNIL